MMISSRQIFKKARRIISIVGETVPVLELDPFIEAKKVFAIGNAIKIEWSRGLTIDDSGGVHTAEIIEILATPSGNYAPDSIFYSLLTSKNVVETFRYTPGDWIKTVEDILQEVKASQ